MQTQDSPKVAINSGRRSHLRGSGCPEGNSTWAGKALLIVVVSRERLCDAYTPRIRWLANQYLFMLRR